MNSEEAKLTKKFYTAFQQRDVDTMIDCYHEDLVFHDPVFQTLNKEKTSKMWSYLLTKGDKNLKIDFKVINSNRVDWEAFYTFSKTGRKVHNKINAQFEFKDGKIIRHIDKFNLWKWSVMALGLPGYLLGWSPLLKRKIRSSVAFIVT